MRVVLLFVTFLTDIHLASCFLLESNRRGIRSTWKLLAENSSSSSSPSTQIDAKEQVKIFGRLAEKYIMLDETAGMCCYSACKDCEYRLPDGGYRMADQSAARPKWIPVYQSRSINGKQHETKWSTMVWQDNDVLDKAMFVERVLALDYAPTLGGPYLAASAAHIEDDTSISLLFDIISQGKPELSMKDAQRRWTEISNGEQGITWAMFTSLFDLI